MEQTCVRVLIAFSFNEKRKKGQEPFPWLNQPESDLFQSMIFLNTQSSD